jgi:DNA polymerase I-like protein with 3'-5' exonuclease and polymerase domains
MHICYLDIECNGFLDDATKIVCVGVKHNNGPATVQYTPEGILRALREAAEADIVVGHNLIAFDIPVIHKLTGVDFGKACWRDTLVLARLDEPDIRESDYARVGFPKELIGSHSLKAWAQRLGHAKGTALDDVTDYSTLQYTPELGEYCAKDVEITAVLYRYLLNRNLDDRAVELEHEFAKAIAQQERNGIGFDEQAAAALYAKLAAERDALVQELRETVPPTEIKLKTKTKYEPFNPASRQQIAAYLRSLGWNPEDYTPSGEAKVDEAILGKLEYPIAKRLSHYLLLQKRIGMLAEGDESWLKLCRNGRIYGRVNPNGAVTGRCTHRNPNVAQVPRVGSPYGSECRALFVADRHRVLVGVDAAGLELRCLAHYMAKWDDGVYGREVLEGDIHTANQKAAGLPTRNDAKTFIYAFLYGAGPAKLGSIVGGGPKEGQQLQKRFLQKVPALAKLKNAIDAAVESRLFLVGIDGRRLRVRSKHAALNTLLQSAGAVLMKQATVLMAASAPAYAARQVAHIHDEVQWEVDPVVAESWAAYCKACITQAGVDLGFRLRIDGDARIGKNWAETH